MDSSRLPGKPLRMFDGRPLLDWLLARLEPARAAFDSVVLATSDRAVDDALEQFAASRGLDCFRGDADDVAARTLAAAETREATHFFRINGDSPCVAPSLFLHASEMMQVDPALDFITNLQPRTWPYGVACELFQTTTFRKTLARMNEPRYREHVTLFFYKHLTEFCWRNLSRPGAPMDHLRLTVDTEEDATRFSTLVAQLGAQWPGCTLDELAAAATKNGFTTTA